MPNLKPNLLALIFTLLIVVAGLVGWLIPAFYAWTDSDQSRPSPLLWQVPLGAAIAALAFCVTLPWSPIAEEAQANAKPLTPLQFSLRTLFWITTGVAIAVVFFQKFPNAGGIIVSAGLVVYFVRFWLRHPQHRLASATLASSMILPYAWVVGYEEFNRMMPTLMAIFVGLPIFLPGAWIGAAFGQHFEQSQWLACLFTALELTLGLWLIRCGPKRAIAYLVLVTLMSATGSLVFYQLCRA